MVGEGKSGEAESRLKSGGFLKYTSVFNSSKIIFKTICEISANCSVGN